MRRASRPASVGSWKLGWSLATHPNKQDELPRIEERAPLRHVDDLVRRAGTHLGVERGELARYPLLEVASRNFGYDRPTAVDDNQQQRPIIAPCDVTQHPWLPIRPKP